MPDVAIVASQVANAPQDYTLPGAQEIMLRAVGCTVNGSTASGSFLPALQMLDPAGHVMWTAVNASSPVAVGRSALVSWFPGGGVDTQGTSSAAAGILKLTSPQGTLSVLNQTGPNTNIDMPTTGVAAGSYGDGSHSVELTVDAEGRLTSATQVPISGGSGTIGFEIGYAQITAPVNITDIAEATATSLISSGALTFDGAPVLCEVFAVVQTDTGSVGDALIMSLFEGSTQITRLALMRADQITLADVHTITAHYRFTPTAGSHTYKLTAFSQNTTGTPKISAGAGGTGGNPPAFLRFTKV